MSSVLGDLPPARFLRDYWQKRPLLIRGALPGFAGLVDRDALFALATRADATSRLLIEHPRRRARWERHDGPFGGLDATMLPRSHWTLLVHGLESLVPGGWELLRAFPFIPQARIDDVMVSYAADGGSVGPHDDRYDVFLLQGPGRRRWQIMHRGNRDVVPGAAIRVLANFVADEEWVLEPGDMLYLPPGVAHHGVAEGPCFTYSIGFLAPSHEALIQNFLGYLGQALAADGMYEDPDLALQKNPLAISDAMIDQVAKVVASVRWDRPMIEEFVGRFLTGPKPHIVFTPPRRPLSPAAFAKKRRFTLALPTRGLVRGARLFLNGEAHKASRATLRDFEALVANRSVRLTRAPDPLFYDWYRAGYLQPD